MALNRLVAHAKLMDATPPIGLIRHVWHHGGGHARAQACRGCACAAMMNDRGHAWEEPVMRRALDQHDIFWQIIHL